MENLKIHDIIELKRDVSDHIDWDSVRNNIVVHENDLSDFVTYSVSGSDFYSVGNLDQSQRYVRRNCPLPSNQNIRYLWQLQTQNMFLIVCDREIIIYDYVMDLMESFETDFQMVRLCALSPHEDFLFVIDDNSNESASMSILLTSNFKIIQKRNFLDDDNQFPNLSRVGWGSDKTQFKGVKKKHDRDPVIEYEKDTDYYCDWSPDNKLVAVSYWTNAKRVVKVYDKDLQPVSVCERIGGLYGPIVWRHDSHFLYAVQRRSTNVEDSDHTHLVAFERNGLRFASVSLQAKSSMYVTRLLWHPELNMLLVVYERAEKIGQSYLHFWMLKNSFWYLKKSMKFENLLKVAWFSGSELLKLSILTKTKHVHYRMKLAIDCTITESAHHLSTICFVNGRHLHLTNFRDVAIPLPASQDCKQFRKIIDCITVSKVRNLIAVQLNGKIPNILIHEWSETNMSYSHTHSLQFKEENMENLVALSNCVMFSDDNPLKWDPQSIIETHATLNFRFRNFQKYFHRFKKIEWKLEDTNMVFFQDFENQLYVSNSLKNETTVDFLIERNVRNFAFGNNYLLIITNGNELKMIHLQEISSKVKQNKSCESSNCKTLQKRPLEAGSDLVTTNAQQAKLILQMPRGNIETIFPRPLLIEKIDTDLQNRRYAIAYNLADKHQVNMNVFYDLCVHDWISQVDDFIGTIYDSTGKDAFETNSKLIKFLLQLENRNILRDLYDGSNRWNSKINDFDPIVDKGFDDKIEKNVKAFLQAINNRENSDCFAATAIVANLVDAKSTANGSETDHKILAALTILDQNRKMNTKMLHFSSEHLLKLAANLIPIDKLLKCCLRHNYLDLALFVISNSDLDPKSIVPFVRQMQTINDSNRRLYEIRHYLKEWSNALEYLVRFGTFEEIFEYVSKYELHEKSIELCTKGAETCLRNENDLKQLCELCAEHFAKQNRWRRAAEIFEIGSFYERSIEMFLKLNDSKTLTNCVRLLKLMGLSDCEFKARVHKILTGSLVSVDFRSIGYLYSEILEDYKNAILNYLKGEFYEEAHLMAIVKNRLDLIDEILKPELLSTASNCLQTFENCNVQLRTHSDRLIEIRKLRSAVILGDSEIVNGHLTDMRFDRYDDDNSSVITSSTTSSLCSEMGTDTGTGTTSRQKRRQKKIDKKLEVIKEGAELEDAAIIKHLHRLITSVYRDELKIVRIVHTLNEIGEQLMAERVRDSYANLLAFIMTKVKVIWPDDVTQFQVECKHNEVGVWAILRNFRHLDIQYRFPPTK